MRGHFVSPLESSSRDGELKFHLGANRNLTLPITPSSPPGSTLGRTLEEIASDVIYLTVLFLSFSFLPLPCYHIFSWCLLSVAWVATSQKYWWFLFFLTPPPPFLDNPTASSFPMLSLRGWQCTTNPLHWRLISLQSFPFLVLLCLGFFFSWRHTVASLPWTPCYRGAESRSAGVSRWDIHQCSKGLLHLLSTSATDDSFPLTTHK